MKDDVNSLDQFVTDLRRITSEGRDEKQVLLALRPLVQRFALSGTWLEPRH